MKRNNTSKQSNIKFTVFLNNDILKNNFDKQYSYNINSFKIFFMLEF